jgi:hypothetical protein
MKSTFLLLSFIVFFKVGLYSQQCYEFRKDFDVLIKILKTDKVNPKVLEISWQITKKLYKLNYTDYIDTVINNVGYISHSLTKTFSDICIKAGGQLGVDYYLKYLNFTDGSAEEERLYALERIFVKFPELVLNTIGQDTLLLSDISWGFRVNRFYGPKSHYANKDYNAITVYDNAPKPILNIDNCRKIFFETNPSLKEKYSKYKFQIDYIIKSATLGP